MMEYDLEDFVRERDATIFIEQCQFVILVSISHLDLNMAWRQALYRFESLAVIVSKASVRSRGHWLQILPDAHESKRLVDRLGRMMLSSCQN